MGARPARHPSRFQFVPVCRKLEQTGTLKSLSALLVCGVHSQSDGRKSALASFIAGAMSERRDDLARGDIMECAGRAQRRRRFGSRRSRFRIISHFLSLLGWRPQALRAGAKRRRRCALPAHSIRFGLLLWGAGCGNSETAPRRRTFLFPTLRRAPATLLA